MEVGCLLHTRFVSPSVLEIVLRLHTSDLLRASVTALKDLWVLWFGGNFARCDSSNCRDVPRFPLPSQLPRPPIAGRLDLGCQTHCRDAIKQHWTLSSLLTTHSENPLTLINLLINYLVWLGSPHTSHLSPPVSLPLVFPGGLYPAMSEGACNDTAVSLSLGLSNRTKFSSLISP